MTCELVRYSSARQTTIGKNGSVSLGALFQTYLQLLSLPSSRAFDTYIENTFKSRRVVAGVGASHYIEFM